jgi:hypothetical protein
MGWRLDWIPAGVYPGGKMKRSIGWCLLSASALLLVLLVGAPLGAAATKGKKVTCKGKKVPVTVGKKTSCLPFAKVFPKPKPVDPLLAQVQEALKFDVSKSGGRKAKRFRSMESGFGAAGKRAQKKLLKVLPKAFALIERKSGGARKSSIDPGSALASACSANGPVDPVGNLGGAGVGVSGDNGGQISVPGGGLTYRVRFAECGSKYIYVAGCPKSNGEAPTRFAGSYTITQEVLEGNAVLSRTTINVDKKLKGLGKVAGDAKLDYYDLEVFTESFIVATGGIVLRGSTDRKARVNMRNGGNIEPGSASARITGDAKPTDDASTFAAYVSEATTEYRAAESGGSFLHDDGWSTFNRQRGAYCAKAVFSPESNTLKLPKGKTGQVSIYAKGEDGGRAVDAKWTLLDQLNAEFSPGSTEGPTPSISYKVINAPENGFIKVKVKFTSTAGVGEDTWTQPTEKGPTINKISGSFSQRSILHVTQGDSVAEISGGATFERFTPAFFGGASGVYKFKSGFVSVEFSGNGAMTFSAPLCSQKGSLQLAFSGGDTFSVFGTGSEQVEPYEYSFTLASDNEPLAMVPIELFNCAPPSAELEGETFEYPAFLGMAEEGTSEDGLSYSGSKTELFSGSGTIETWSFTGTE